MAHATVDIPSRRPRVRRGGFTVVELLLVVALIIALLSILLVAVNKAVFAAQGAKTETLIVTIQQGLVRFHEDVGYYPPVLDVNRNLAFPPDPDSGGYPAAVQAWSSVTTLADYLIGYGDDQEDAFDGLGLRTPGRDGVWGATVLGAGAGQLADRNAGGGAASSGQVLGPYVELKDTDLIASTDGTVSANGILNVYFPGDAGYDPTDPKVICDHWGSPIRYYRRPYPALDQDYRAVDRTGDGISDPVPTLSDVIALRPFNLDVGSEADSPVPDADGDTSTTLALQSAEFALLSPGPDRQFDATRRRDSAALNLDNIVEVGP